MQKNNGYYYSDDYMYFTFNTKSSSQYNLIIQNDIEDLKVYADRNTSVDFLQPKYQTGQYFLGVSNPQRQFPLKLVTENVTKRDIREILKWLETGTIGSLSFDYAPDWEYDVIVSSLKDPNIYPQNDTFIMSFEVVFTTLEQAIAKNKFDGFAIIDVTTIGDEIINSNITHSCGIPSFSIRKNPFKSNPLEYTACVHFLGNQKITIGINASNNSTTTVEEGVDQNLFLSISVPNLYENQYNEINIIPKISGNWYEVEYNNSANLFLVDGQVGEYLKLKEIIDSESIFIHNPTSLSLTSPGEPILINRMTTNEIANLISTNYNWFIYERISDVDTNLEYYVPTSYIIEEEGKIKGIMRYDDILAQDEVSETAETIYNLINEDQTHQFYFGFYDTFSIETNYQKIKPTVRQYTYTL